MKYYIIAGEASGDLHGSNLIKEIKKLDADTNIRGWGGHLMQGAGAEVVKHYKDLAFMGFAEVIKNLPAILQNISFCKKDIEEFKPDVLILIDYPGFNLRIAEWAKKNNYKIIYYISPQVWAWKESRVRMIKKVVDKMIVILPFEKNFYEDKWDYKVEYVGHPLVQVVDEFIQKEKLDYLYTKPIIALLPGSRKQEVVVKLPLMLEAAKSFPQYQFLIAKAASLDEHVYQKILKDFPFAGSVTNDTYNLLSQSIAALVTSGTATLETALFGVPQVVCYKGSFISYQIAKKLVKIKYISLVNLIMDDEVVKELIQQDFNVKNIVQELDSILYNDDKISAIKTKYAALKDLLAEGGNASSKASEIVVNLAATSSLKA